MALFKRPDVKPKVVATTNDAAVVVDVATVAVPHKLMARLHEYFRAKAKDPSLHRTPPAERRVAAAFQKDIEEVL